MKDILDKFLKNWQYGEKLDAGKLLSFINDYALLFAKKMGIEQSFRIQWKHNQNLFILGSFDDKTNTIFFNINRISALQKYKINSESNGFANFVDKFLSNFSNTAHDEVDNSLYFTLTSKERSLHRFLGDYEQIPYDIATTILHELRHLYQAEQAERQVPFFLFITQNKLRELQTNFSPLREPAEIDAIYFQLVILREYCYSNNLSDIFSKSYAMTVPKLNASDIENNFKFIIKNAKLNTSTDSITKLKQELDAIYDWSK